MEKVCEYCTALRPVVYCKADAAHLCLFCDAKVHSANTLSNRHPRALLCEMCRQRPAYIKCSDHKMFICRGCDCNLHKDSFQPQKRLVSSYIGCPSAKDFALLWGFEMNKLENGTSQDRFVATSHVLLNTGMENTEISEQSLSGTEVRGHTLESQGRTLSSIHGAESDVGPRSQHAEVFYKDNQRQNTDIILQQILELERLQLTEGNNGPSFIRGSQQSDLSSSPHDTSWMLNKSLQYSLGVGKYYHPEMNIEPFASSFPPLEDLTSSSTAGNPLQGEPLWQCGSPDQGFEMWSQNKQDLGFCEELACFDSSNIPDVDLTFRNFEELFGCDQYVDKALLDEKDLTCTSMDKDISLHELDHSHAKGTEVVLVASSAYNNQSPKVDKDVVPSDQARNGFDSEGCSYPVHTSYSTMSLSLSRFSTENNSTDYMDSSFSPLIVRQEPPCKSEPKIEVLEAKEKAWLRCNDKKNARRYEKQTKDYPEKSEPMQKSV